MNVRTFGILILSLLLQIFVFNGMGNFMTYLPYFGLLPVILFPLKGNRYLFLIFSFVTGLVMDITLSTGGVFAAASLIFAFLRDYFIQLIKSDALEKKDDWSFWTFGNLLIYLGFSSLLLTAIIYVILSWGLNHSMSFYLDIFLHAGVNLFFYGVFTFLFIWDNAYQH